MHGHGIVLKKARILVTWGLHRTGSINRLSFGGLLGGGLLLL